MDDESRKLCGQFLNWLNKLMDDARWKADEYWKKGNVGSSMMSRQSFDAYERVSTRFREVFKP